MMVYKHFIKMDIHRYLAIGIICFCYLMVMLNSPNFTGTVAQIFLRPFN